MYKYWYRLWSITQERHIVLSTVRKKYLTKNIKTLLKYSLHDNDRGTNLSDSLSEFSVLTFSVVSLGSDRLGFGELYWCHILNPFRGRGDLDVGQLERGEGKGRREVGFRTTGGGRGTSGRE